MKNTPKFTPKITPLLMQGPLVLASLRGDKTQTRRGQGLKEVNEKPDDWSLDSIGETGNAKGHIGVCAFFRNKHDPLRVISVHCPWGGPGDLFYVRETWAKTNNVNDQSPWPDRPHKKLYANYDREVVIYAADGPWQWLDDDGAITERSHWKPSIHMPRWASRLTGRLIDVRMDRVNQISGANAMAEGCRSADHVTGRECLDPRMGSYRLHFRDLYESINGADSFDSRWNWVLVYEPIGKNVDEVLRDMTATRETYAH